MGSEKDKRKDPPRLGVRSPRGAGSGSARQRHGKPTETRGDRGLRARLRNPIFRFVATLAILMIVANIVLATDLFKERLIPQYLQAWASVSAATLNVFGENARVMEHTIWSNRFSVNIKKGCDAVQPTVLFITAVLASPVAFWSKLPGLAIGFLFLMFMNLVRVISLFYIGIYWNAAFDTMHHDVWQAVFIILSILAWALWALWAVKKTMQQTVRLKHAPV